MFVYLLKNNAFEQLSGPFFTLFVFKDEPFDIFCLMVSVTLSPPLLNGWFYKTLAWRSRDEACFAVVYGYPQLNFMGETTKGASLFLLVIKAKIMFCLEIY